MSVSLILGSGSVPLTYVSLFVPVEYCFDYVSFAVNLESGSMTSPTSLFFLLFALALWSLLWFHGQFRITYPLRNAIGVLIQMSWNL